MRSGRREVDNSHRAAQPRWRTDSDGRRRDARDDADPDEIDPPILGCLVATEVALHGRSAAEVPRENAVMKNSLRSLMAWLWNLRVSCRSDRWQETKVAPHD